MFVEVKSRADFNTPSAQALNLIVEVMTVAISAIWHASVGDSAAVRGARGRDTLTPQLVLHRVATGAPLLPQDTTKWNQGLIAQAALVTAETAFV